MKCYNCGRFFSDRIRKCEGLCQQERQDFIGRMFCKRCCRTVLAGLNHTGGDSQNTKAFYCRVCGDSYPLEEKCDCCKRATMCGSCCVEYRHPCCWQKIHWRESLNPVAFVYPEPKVFPNPSFTDSEHALKILGGIANTLSPRGFLDNHSKRFASVEVEVSEYSNALALNEALAKWGCSVVRDGSIVSGNGFEINTAPSCGDSLKVQLSEICEGLQAADATVDQSCGLHVHIDCRDLGYQEIQRVVAVYSRIEQALFASVHPARADNNYCRPCGEYLSNGILKGIKPDTKTVKEAIIKKVYGEDAIRLYDQLYLRSKRDHYGRIGHNRNEVRYSALNLHTYFLRGTLEFRLHHGAVDFNEIYGWSKLLIELIDAVSNTPYTKLQGILTRIAGQNPIEEGVYLLGQLVSSDSLAYFNNKLGLMDQITNNKQLCSYLPANLMRNYRMKTKPFLEIDNNLGVK